MIFETLLTVAFYFVPFEISDDFPKWETWILFFLMTVRFGSSEQLNKYFRAENIRISICKALSRFFQIEFNIDSVPVPVINNYFEKHGLHPFLFGSLCWMACSVLCVFLNKKTMGKAKLE